MGTSRCLTHLLIGRRARARASCSVLLLTITFACPQLSVIGVQRVQAETVGRAGERQVEVLSHHLKLTLLPHRHRLVATDHITLKVLRPDLRHAAFSLSAALRVTRLQRQDGVQVRPVAFTTETVDSGPSGSAPPEPGFQRVTVSLDPPVEAGQILVMSWDYEGTLNDPPRQARHLRFVTPSQTAGHIGEEGIYLSSETRWYPDIDGSLSTYEIEVSLPEGWESVTQGRRVSRVSKNGTVTAAWKVATHAEALTLVANRFVTHRRDWQGIEISTYFFPEDAHLAQEYLEATQRYLETYTKLLGPYPFAKFAVVENFFPSGLGMPSFTLLGSRVIKRHYTQPYALGHEIVHSWIGNSVLNDVEQGNWVEGLTTYLANYYYEELTGTAEQAREQRRRMLLGYAVYVWLEDDYPVASFRYKTDQKDNAIGYQKAAMIFHMLRREIGDQAFWSGVRNLVARRTGTYASWLDLEKEFSSAAGRDLRWFFAQWVERAGAPSLRVADATARGPAVGREGVGGYQVTIRLRQEGEEQAYRLRVPILVGMPGGKTHAEVLEMEGADQTFTLTTPGKPIRLQIDPDYESFRRISRRALPPMLNLYVTDRVRSLVLPTGGSDAEREPYQALARRIASSDQGSRIKQGAGLDPSTMQGSILILGGPALNPAADWAVRGCEDRVTLGRDTFSIGGRVYEGSEMALLISCRHPERPEHVVTIFYGLSPDAAAKVARLLFFYGWQSYLVFRDGAVVARGDFAPRVNELEVVFYEQQGQR